MFCAQITFWQSFKNRKQGGCLPPSVTSVGGAKQPPGLMSLNCYKRVIDAQNMLIYFRLHYLYICQGG